MKRKNEIGASAIEFAIILPFLILLVCGTIEFGLIFYNKQVITNASREGARAGITSPSTEIMEGDVKQIVADYCTGRLFDIPNGFHDLSLEEITIVPGTHYAVTVRTGYSFLFTQFLGFDQIMISARTVMGMEPS